METSLEIFIVSRADSQSYSSPEAALLLVSNKSCDLAGSDFLNMRREFVSYSQPIRFVRLDSEHAQSDVKSTIHGLPVLDSARGRDSRC